MAVPVPVMRRRAWMRFLAAAAALLPIGRTRLFAQPVSLGPVEAATLRALARVVLPTALGEERLGEVIAEFLAWLRGYREGAELDHGYGFTKLRWTARTPGARYPAQLAALEAAARERGGAFATLPAAAQRDLGASALAAAKLRDLPERPDGRHVASDLMCFFFRSGAANDLCYRARIGREDCRGLPGSEQPPEPLDEGGGA